MISKKDVQHVAKLARLGLTKREENKFQKELSLILGYVEKLKKVDVSGIEPTSHPLRVENVMRKDEAQKSESQKSNELVEMAPVREKRHIKVKSILR